MSSITQGPLHALGSDLPHALPHSTTLSSTDDSMVLSENEAHDGIESQATTPFATPKRKDPEDVPESSNPQDAAIDVSKKVEDAPSIGSQDCNQSEAGGNNSETSQDPSGVQYILEMAEDFLLRARPNGIPALPPRLRIKSLPLKRILFTLTDGALNMHGPSGLTFSRPYKMFACFESQIRRRLSEIQTLCNEPAGPALVMDTDLDLNKPTNTVIVAEFPPQETLTQEEREDIIFTSGYDWKYLTAEEREEAASDLGVLISFIDEYISPLRNAIRDADDFQVHFQELWHLFYPGSIAYVKDPGVPQKLWRVVRSSGGKFSPRLPNGFRKRGGLAGGDKWLPLLLDCYYLDFDGNNFVRILKTFQVDHFEGLSGVSALPIIPLNFAVRDGFVDVDTISKRGEDFISYTKWSYSYYRGRSLIHEPEGAALCHPQKDTIDSLTVLSEAIESPVVVDFDRCLRAIPTWRPGRTSRGLSRVLDERGGDLRQPPEPPGSPGLPPVSPPGYDDDGIWDVRLAEKVLKYTDPTQPAELHGQDPPSGDDVLLLPNRVFAFILRTRKWACLPLGSGVLDNQAHSLMRMEEDPQAWDNLQIDDGHRSIIKSLMATHFRKKKSERRQFDIIQDKGKGLIILLHGVPGLPETVAQYYNKPLLPITCGDLGMTPAEVENNFQSSFQMAQAWDCVLLLDEADVFLAERSQDNIERNALVSVFLRVMEYYEGILFLTTNKVGSFDEAFKSRMSMALYYPPLTREQTRRIWEMQMKRTEALSKQAAPEDEYQHVRFKHEEVAALAEELWNMQTTVDYCRPVWNGRQIRNAFQTAVALAEWHKGEGRVPGPIVVGREHFEKVAKVSNEFNAYLYEVKHGRADYEKAHAREHRFDDFNRQQFVFGGHQGAGFGQVQQGYGIGPQLGSSTMPYSGGQAGINPMGGGVPYGSNTQIQGAFFTNQGWQPGYGGVSNTGIGGLNMAGPSMGASGGGTNMGPGMSPGSVNVQVPPGLSIQGQLNNQQQQQQQQQQGGSSMGPGGPMLPGFR
ncbi:uncharacterized protein GLRG_09760 [Colletotrichum graminicola M1.001]|uniref:Uncharacterized protein n=1 Tax=Colletotrichum graminicola (strain M1.001 / M2 / FGSC 10212) TaxID=645133 RepID=E3QUS8_COLGM|nr:uncharacterized protein GLRG_09760 [Colletotrichum graminicola M1.001]EFQ34616.1 hypothetical protein GLRG_09760 [Colletotrichum graminicola M1.001]